MRRSIPDVALLHRDPVDRLRVWQAIVRALAILTPDPLIAACPVRVICQGARQLDLLRPLPFSDPNRLVFIWLTDDSGTGAALLENAFVVAPLDKYTSRTCRVTPLEESELR